MIIFTKVRETFLLNQCVHSSKKTIVRPYLFSFLKIGKDFFSKYGKSLSLTKSFSLTLSASLTLVSLFLFTACAAAGSGAGSAGEANALSSLTLEISGVRHDVNFNGKQSAKISTLVSETTAPPKTAIISNIKLKLKQWAVLTDMNKNVIASGSTIDMPISGDNRKIEIHVTGKDDSTLIYTITVVFINTDALISNLTLSLHGIDHSVAFDKNNEATINGLYRISTNPNEITIKTLLISKGATITDSDGNNLANASSVPIISKEGTYTLTLIVTAEDSSTSEYTITLDYIPPITLSGHTGNITSVAFHPDGSKIVSAGHDRNMKIWDVTKTNPTVITTLSGIANWINSTISYSPDGSKIASGSWDNIIKIWDATVTTDTTNPIAALSGHTAAVYSIAFSPDGSRLASGSQDNTVKTWNAMVTEDVSDPIVTLSGHTDNVTSVAFHPDGSKIVSGSFDNTIKIWSATLTANSSTPIATLSEHTDNVRSVAFNSDGSKLVSGGDDNTIKIWNTSKLGDATPTAPLIVTLSGHTARVTSVVFSPDDDTIASGSWDDTIEIWDASVTEDSSVSIATLSDSNNISSLTFSPDGSRLVSGSWDNTIKIWR